MQPGQRYGKYLLLERIAHGGMAEIFKAKALGAAGFEKNVAIKRLHSRYAEDREVIAMLQDEARIVSQLNHQNICQVLDLGRVEDTYYIAMEYVDGADLASVMRRASKYFPRALPYPAILFVMNEMLSGLDYAHRKNDPSGDHLGIIHRDISPQNVLISLEGEVKIIDFGIAKAKGQSHKTEAGVIKGKFRYMSPEQARGEPIDHRADLFAAGVVLYEMVLGHPHSRGLTDMQVLVRIQQGYLDPLDQLIPDLPGALAEMVDRALAPRPEDRWPSAGQFKRSIDAFRRANGLTFNRDSMSELMGRIFPEHAQRRTSMNSLDALEPGDLLLESNPGMTQELGLDELVELEPSRDEPDPAEAATAYATPLIQKTPSPSSSPKRQDPRQRRSPRGYQDPRKNRRRAQRQSPAQPTPQLAPDPFSPPPPTGGGMQTDPGLKAAWDAHMEAKNPPPPKEPKPPPPAAPKREPTPSPAFEEPLRRGSDRHRHERTPHRSESYKKRAAATTMKTKGKKAKPRDPERSGGMGATFLYLLIIGVLLGGAGYIGWQYWESIKNNRRTTAPAKEESQKTKGPHLVKTTLEISTKPKKGARIFINGRYTGRKTPTVLEIQAPSPVVVELVKQGYPRWVNEFPLTPGEPLRIEADLRRPPRRGSSTSRKTSTQRRRRRRRRRRGGRTGRTGRTGSRPTRPDPGAEPMGAVYGPGVDGKLKGTIVVKSAQKAWVYINGQRMGISPYRQKLKPGSYKVVLKKGPKSSVPKFVTIEGGLTKTIKLKLR